MEKPEGISRGMHDKYPVAMLQAVQEGITEGIQWKITERGLP